MASRRLLVLALLGPLSAVAQAPLTGVRARQEIRLLHERMDHPFAGTGTQPWSLRTGLTLGAEANDNINVSAGDPQSDLILRPGIILQLGYRFTPVNSLRLDLDAGYAMYLDHPENDHFFLNSDSTTGLSLDLLVKETRINLHSGVSLEQNPLDEGEVSARSDYRRFQNATGFRIESTEARLQTRFGYDHIVELHNSTYRAQDRSMENVSAEVGYQVTEATVYGLWLNGGYFNPHGDERSEALSVGAGADVKLRASENLQFSAEAGYGYVDFYEDDGSSDAQQQGSFVGALAAQHRVNQWLTHRLRASTDVVPSLNSNYRQLYLANHSADWNIWSRVLLTTELFYEHSVSSLETDGERYDRLGTGLGLRWSLAREMEARLEYRFVWKNSNLPESEYQQNQVKLVVTKWF